MALFDTILSRPEFADHPPVLVDIGAAGRIHPVWKPIAKHCIAIAFDPDDREMGYIENEKSGYKKLYVFNRAVTATEEDEVDFYLTKQPQTSSTLPPHTESVARLLMADYFELKSVGKMGATQLPRVLDELKLPGIDWFKTDSQGLDLRLFQSLGEQRMMQTLVAEFEPGIIPGYVGEDMLHELMTAMAQLGFLMTSMNVRGPERLRPTVADKYFSGKARTQLRGYAPKCPGWADVTYINELNDDAFTLRDHLLTWTFATLLGQHGLALELADQGKTKYTDPLFDQMIDESVRHIKRRRLKAIPWSIKQFAKRFLRPDSVG